MLETFRLLVYKFLIFCGVSIQILAALVQKELQNLKKKFFLEHPSAQCNIVLKLAGNPEE